MGALLTAGAALALETDPYTNRDMDLADSLEIMDAKTNEALDRIAASWSRGENERAFVTAVYKNLGGLHWVDKLERWAMNAPEVDRLPISRKESVFAELPLHAARISRLWGHGRTMNINGTYIGTDKLGHFLSQGRKFYSRYHRLGSVERAARRTTMWESLIWGHLTTGIFSNADLVANYEGFLFYRGLFHNGVVAGKTAMFRWQDGRPLRQRSFSWTDHVNAFWDEALNPNVYVRALVPHMQRRMLRLCADYARRPERYRVTDEEALRARYAQIGMRDGSVLEATRVFAENCPVAEKPAPS